MNARLEEAVRAKVKGLRLSPVVGGRTLTGMEHGSGGASHTARLRERHHTIARFVAAKMPDERICFIMGMTQESLDRLKDQTPAFQELVYHYSQRPPRAEREEEYLDQKHRIAKMAQLELHDRLAEEPDKFSASELLRIQDSYDDRTGYSKQSVNVQVNLDLAAKLEYNRRQRALAGARDGGEVSSMESPPGSSASPLLELKAEPIPTPPEPALPPYPTAAPAPPPMAEVIEAGRMRYRPKITEKMRRV